MAELLCVDAAYRPGAGMMADGAFDLAADTVELAPYVPPEAEPAPLREVVYRADAWTAEDLARLRELFAADEAMADIAGAVGHTFHATRTQVCRLGLRRNSKRPWSEFEDAEIARRYGDDSTAAIAQDIGRSCSSVYQRAFLLGLTEGRPPPYTEWEDAQIRAGYAAGVPVAQIAALIGRPLSSVLNRAFDHLDIRHINAPPTWSRAELDLALALAGEGLTNRRIQHALEDAGFPPRTLQAVKIAMMRLVEGRGWGRTWTCDEDELIGRAYAEGASLAPLRERLGRSRQSIAWRAGYLGLHGTHVQKAGWRTEPCWTAEEDAVLRASFGKVRGKKLNALFDRPMAGIYMRARALGLKGDYCRAYRADEDRAIHIAWRRGVGLTDLALAMDRDVAAVHRRATLRLKLNFGDPARPKASRIPRAKRPPPPTLEQILAMEPADVA